MPAKAPSKKPTSKKTKAEPRTNATRTTSTFSPRLLATHAALDAEITRLFPNREERFEYGMRGWRVPRPRRVEAWKGTIDPNFLHIYIAERKNGITLHFWNPLDTAHLYKNAKGLTAAGFKVMVGCLQFNLQGDFPIGAVKPLLEAARRGMDNET